MAASVEMRWTVSHPVSEGSDVFIQRASIQSVSVRGGERVDEMDGDGLG
jgi:hypothetical protein